jgi:hypothetical protein
VRAAPTNPDLRNRLAFWALAMVGLLVAHDAVHLAQIGPGQALVAELRSAGHGYWGTASLALSAIAVIGTASSLIRLRRLRMRASALGAVPASSLSFGRRFVAAWWRLAAVVAIGFALQENIEHLVAHRHAMGTGALLGPEFPLAVPVIGAIAAIAAAIATVVAGAQQAIVAAIEAALRARLRRVREAVRRSGSAPAAIGSVLARPGAGRAPPPLLVSGS